MPERRTPRSAIKAQRSETTPQARDDQVERALGRAFAFGVPILSLGGALAVGAVASVGSALLVLAAGALLGGIGLLWASVRTLSGDAPLPATFETLERDRHGTGALVEEKRRLLLALKDIEGDHELGRTDDADYTALVADYRQQAKAVMRKMDVEVAPFLEEAERLANDFLKERSLPVPGVPEGRAARERNAERIVCAGCSASNEPDAAFCKRCGSSLKKEPRNAQT
jgi:ribosomal protein L40E